jgi:hypothetical protein
MLSGSGRGRYGRRNRGLVVGGKLTGGGKFPFLVIVDWYKGSVGSPFGDPRVRALLWCYLRSFQYKRSFHSPLCAAQFLSYDIYCHGVMIAHDVVLTWSDCWPRK